MKRFVSLMILVLIIIGLTSLAFAVDIPSIGDGTVLSSQAGGTVNSILGAIQWIGYAIAVGMLIYVGIKYVISSAQEKASLKSNLIRYVIGAIIIAGAVTIVPWITGLVGSSAPKRN